MVGSKAQRPRWDEGMTEATWALPLEEELSGRVGRSPIRLALILTCAFFASWAAGLQGVAPFRLSKVFPLGAMGLVLYWGLFVRHKFRTFPTLFNVFLAFVVAHTVVTYLFFHPELLEFRYRGEVLWRGGLVLEEESHGIRLARFFLFAFFGYALASLLRSAREVTMVALVFGAGFTLSVVLGVRGEVSQAVTFARSSGGYHNANSFGAAAMTCVFLSLFVLQHPGTRRWARIGSAGSALAGLYGLLVSASRTAILGVCGGMLVMLAYSPLRRRLRNAVCLCLIVVVALMLLPEHALEALVGRSAYDYLVRSRASKRFDIWSDYVRAFPKYALVGTGLKRSMTATAESYTTSEPKIPHNTYLQVAVEFGCVGLVLFLAAMWQLWRRVASPLSPRIPTDSVMLGLFAAWTFFFLGGTFGSRVFWVSWAIVAGYGHWRSQAGREGALGLLGPL